MCLAHRVASLSTIGADAPMPFAEPGVEAHYGPSRAAEILHLDLKLALYPAQRTFEGAATLRLRAFPAWKGELALDLDDVHVDSVVDPAGADLSWEHSDGKLTIRAEKCPAAVTIAWSGANPTRGMYFTGPEPWAPDRAPMAWTQCQDEDGHFVLPCQDHPSVKHPWTVELTGPSGYTLLSNGAVVARTDDGERSVARFEQREPMPAYLFTAVAARLTTVEAPSVKLGDRDIAVRYLVPQGEEEAVERAMGKTPRMIAEFSKLVGVDYPWPRYDQVVVHDFVFGGMENTGCTTMIDILLVDRRTVPEWDPDGLVAHELAHQWFGDLVTCQDWSQGWLNESWATFMELVWWEIDRSAADATWYRWENLERYLDEAGGRYRRPIVSYDFREPIDVFDRHLYEKGALVLMTLRAELGDEAFWAGVRTYLQRHAHTTVHTRHFQRALEDASGRNLDRFFQQWVHSPGHPAISVKLKVEDGLLLATVSQTQKDDGVPAVYAASLRFELVFEDGTRRTVDLSLTEKDRTLAVPLEGRLATVRVDPGFRLLADLKLEAPEAWLVKLLADPDPVLALRAARGLLAADSGRALAAVVDALSTSPHRGTRSRIAAALAERGGDRMRDALIGALGTEQDPVAKRAIADALGSFRDGVVADALIGVLAGPATTWHLHGAALVALGKTRDPRAIAEISAHLDVDSWSDVVRQRAIHGLAATEDAAAMDVLLAASGRDRTDRVRGAAALGLAKLGDKVEPVRRRAVERLVEMLAEPGFRSQLNAIDALATIKDPAALGALSGVHRTAPDGRTRRHAYEAMTRIRAGRTADAGLSTLRRTVERLGEDSQKLRDRLEKLERPPSGEAGA